MFAASAAGKGQRQAAEPSYYYEDNGCEVAATCLQCPLPRCKHDDMEWYIRHRRLASDLRMATIIREEGLSIDEAAERFRHYYAHGVPGSAALSQRYAGAVAGGD